MKRIGKNSENTEARILAAAEKVFAEKGLRGSRINDIAKLARLNIAANEVDDVVDKLSRIVEFVDQLQALYCRRN